MDECHCHVEPVGLTPREVADTSCEVLEQPDRGRHRLDPAVELRPAEPGERPEQTEVLPGRDRRVDPQVLWRETEQPVRRFRIGVHVGSADERRAQVRAPEPGRDR